MLLGNSYGEEITRNLNVPNSVNNIWLIQGMSGSGKSTFCKNIIKSAAGDGVSVIVIDYSKSYIHKDMPYISDEDYHIIEREGLGIDAFKPKSINIEGYDKKETLSDTADRMCDSLCSALNIKGVSQRDILGECIRNEIEGGTPTFAGILNRVRQIKLAAAESLALKMMGMKDVKFGGCLVEWNKIISNKRVTVFQFSHTSESKRTFLTELLLNDLWDFVKRSENDKGFLLILDEIQNMKFKGDCFLSHLRKFRKFGIGAVMATQFVGNSFSKAESGELLEQAATKVYFKPDNGNMLSVAKSVDAYKYKDWLKTFQSLKVGECVYSGITDQSPMPQSVVLKVPPCNVDF